MPFCDVMTMRCFVIFQIYGERNDKNARIEYKWQKMMKCSAVSVNDQVCKVFWNSVKMINFIPSSGPIHARVGGTMLTLQVFVDKIWNNSCFFPIFGHFS